MFSSVAVAAILPDLKMTSPHLPILVDFQNQMHLAGTLQDTAQMRELFFRVLAQRVGRLHMTKGDVHRDLGNP